MVGHDANLVKLPREDQQEILLQLSKYFLLLQDLKLTVYMSSLCTRFIFSNLVLAVPEMSNHSTRVATSQPEGGRTVSLQSLCHYHSAMLTTHFTVGDPSLLDDPFIMITRGKVCKILWHFFWPQGKWKWLR